jgi:DNA-binding protein YbaB
MDLSNLNLGKEFAALGLDNGLDWLTKATEELDQAFDETVATAVSADRLVKVTVTGRGEVREVEFDPGICRGTTDPRVLAATVLDTIRRAHAAADVKLKAAYDAFQERLDG